MTDFGTDVSCTTSLRSGRLVSGLRLVGEAAFRRLTTPAGSLVGGEDEANYGIDLTSFVGQPNPKLLAATLPGRIRAELKKDERINAVKSVVFVNQSGASTELEITISIETDIGPFDLKIAVNEVRASLVGLSV